MGVPRGYVYTRPTEHSRGSAHVNAKLTEADIPRIFQLRREGYKQYEIAAMFKVSKPQISLVLSRKAWTHVEVPSE
jgi:transcriptional regulator